MKTVTFFCGLFFLSGFATAVAWFDHDRAVCAGNNNEWQKASELLQNLAMHNPDNAEQLYDAGVALYKSQQFLQAETYFNAALKHAKDKQQQEQIHYNLGNTHAQQKKWKEAIASYERALNINAGNKKTQHNLELVKKMLQQQKKNEQDPEQDKKNKKDDEQKKSDDDSQDESKSDGQDKDAGENDSQEKQDGKQEMKDSSNPRDDKKEQESQQQKNEQEKKSESQKKQQEKKEQKQKKTDDLQSGSLGDNKEQQKKEKQAPQLEQALAELLDKREKQDAQGNKQMIKATVGKQMAGGNGKNCW